MFLYEYSTDMIAKAAELADFDGVEFWIETPHFWVDRDESKLDCFSDMCLAFHAPVIDLNPVSVNAYVCNVTLKETLYSISLASRRKVELVTLHAGRRSAAREPVWADYLALHRYVRIARRYAKLKSVEIALENSEAGINNLCKTPEELQEFAERYDILVTLDVKHALLNGGIEGFVEALFNRIANIHVSYYDSKNRHVEPSRGREVADALRMLSELGYDKLITLELDDLGIGNLDYAKKVEILRREGNFIRSFF